LVEGGLLPVHEGIQAFARKWQGNGVALQSSREFAESGFLARGVGAEAARFLASLRRMGVLADVDDSA
jgi:hypothetical protein